MDVGQRNVQISDQYEIIGMAGVNYLPLKKSSSDTYRVVLCRLDGLGRDNTNLHYDIDDAFTDHYRFITQQLPFAEFDGRDRVTTLMQNWQGKATTEIIDNIFSSIDPDAGAFTLESISVENGYLYGEVRLANSIVGTNLSMMLNHPRPDQAALIFGVRYLSVNTRLDGLQYADVKKICAYDVNIVSETELTQRRNGVK
ncbi:hypothetical protein SPECIALG_93 [Erwinia phage vB_EamM_Special G]|uniref:Uncharacterized protein n=1 Tax=Erwinia phage vB_EamM_Special G TaxID=1815989 RepID=A0A191ZBY6_9CAUD|nr:hypothetical protein FDI00_gp093 [Erwinia phage vB_EamM_Special G]ANJ64903.2 hypothetical protein SPECIALG_93 [Erwinia phage vB_EamM_Special G]